MRAGRRVVQLERVTCEGDSGGEAEDGLLALRRLRGLAVLPLKGQGVRL